MGIEISKVTKNFGDTRALSQVDLELKEQGLYGLLGNNGAGKTTLFNIITNRLYPDGGSVCVDGEPVADRDEVLGKIYMMGEENYYPEDMKVFKAFEKTGLFYPQFDLEKALELSRQFGLDARHRDMFYKALIEKYAEAPCTIVISTHLIQEVAHIISHAIVIRDGSIRKMRRRRSC